MTRHTYTIAANDSDRLTVERAMRADDAFAALWDIQTELRNYIKHSDPKDADEAIERVREIVADATDGLDVGRLWQ